MTKEPRSEFYDVSLSEAIADVPGSLNDLPVGMWQMVDFGRKAFGLEGPELADYLRRCIHALMDAGAKPVAQREGSSKWYLQVQYGSNKHEVAEAVIQEWLRQGALTPEPWEGLWFGLPWSYLPGQRE